MKRRDLLIAIPTALAAVAVAAWRITRALTAPDENAVAAPQPVYRALPPELLAASVGMLTEPEIEQLWQLSEAIATRWQMHALERSSFVGTLALKCNSEPSYLAEYRNSLELHGQAQASWETLLDHSLTLNADAIARPDSTLAHFRCYVVDELIALHLVRGGARSYGFESYRGWMTGTFTYRKAKHA